MYKFLQILETDRLNSQLRIEVIQEILHRYIAIVRRNDAITIQIIFSNSYQASIHWKSPICNVPFKFALPIQCSRRVMRSRRHNAQQESFTSLSRYTF